MANHGNTANDLLRLDRFGLYCPAADVWIDPTRPVERALISHGHADHARAGHGSVLATAHTLAIMAVRYGVQFAGETQVAELGQPIQLGDVAFTFFPAGHVLGSAQILIERKGERIVFSGDYKRAADPTCQLFEPVKCDVFITEATFGLPVFKHPAVGNEIDKLLASRRLFPDRPHLIGAYALGKAQRVIAEIRAKGVDETIYLHGALKGLCDLYKSHAIDLGNLEPVGRKTGKDLSGALVLAPPGALNALWARRFIDPVIAVASGWMQIRARARQRGAQLPLIISDHADWPDLCRTILETEAGEIWVTHGQEDALVHWCQTQGLTAQPLDMVGYGEEEDHGVGDGQDTEQQT